MTAAPLDLQCFDDPLDPNDLKDYSLDWRLERALADGDTISASSWDLGDAAIDGVETTSDTFDDTSSTIWLRVNPGQVAAARWFGVGCTYRVTNTITTAGGRTIDRSVLLTVRHN